jgi:hypothetical protein
MVFLPSSSFTWPEIIGSHQHKGLATLPLLECLEVEDRTVPQHAYSSLVCPVLSLFVCIVHHPQLTFNCVVENMIFRHTASLETLMIRSTSDNIDVLTSRAMRILFDCKQLRNLLLEGPSLSGKRIGGIFSWSMVGLIGLSLFCLLIPALERHTFE